jgi:hypothetical protein
MLQDSLNGAEGRTVTVLIMMVRVPVLVSTVCTTPWVLVHLPGRRRASSGKFEANWQIFTGICCRRLVLMRKAGYRYLCVVNMLFSPTHDCGANGAAQISSMFAYCGRIMFQQSSSPRSEFVVFVHVPPVVVVLLYSY